MKIPYRFATINAFLRKSIGNRRHHVGLSEFAVTVFRPGKRWRGMRWVDHIENPPEAEDRIRVWIKGMPRPFTFPRAADFLGLCSTIDEACNPGHWHQYQIKQTRVGPDDVVVDCGGAEGLFSLQAASVARHVYVVEPLQDFFDCLNDTFRGVPNVTILQCCAGETDKPGQLFVEGFYSSQAGSNGNNAQATTVRSLDSLFSNLEKPITYIKADIEGFELEMLHGAKGIISKSKPKIALTTYHGPNDVDEIEGFLSSLRPDYAFLRKGLTTTGKPTMLHAW